MEKNLKISNKKQMEKLVELMKKNPDLGRGKLPFGMNKMQLKEKWENFSVELNSLGPPITIAKEWQRVWTHYKANLKRKLATNKRNFQATGGGPSTEISLSPLEQDTVELVSMQTQINPCGSAMGLQAQEDSDAAESIIVVQPSPSTKKNDELQLPRSCKIKNKAKLEDERLKMLREQAKNQEEILKTLKRLEKNSYYEINKKTYDLKKKKVDLQIELLKAKIELTRKKLE